MSTPYTVGATWYAHGGMDPETGGHTTDGGRVFGIDGARYAECDHYGCPAVVVIDPEVGEQVARLVDLLDGVFNDVRYDGAGPSAVELAQVALRSLIADPKPEEPTGLGAVVEVESSRPGLNGTPVRLVRGHATWQPWMGDGRKWEWAELNEPVKVLSEGVTA